MDTKTCTGCGRELPATLEYFNKDGRPSRPLLRAKCKGCEKAYREANKEHKQVVDRKYREAHKKEIRERKSEYYRSHKDHELGRYYEWRDANRDHYLEYQRCYGHVRTERKRIYDAQYRERNRKRIMERQKAWLKSNPEHSRLMYRVAVARYSARKRNAEGHHTAQDIENQYKRQKGKCYYCGIKLGKTYHVDHVVPLSRGGSNGPDNLVITCQHCNVTKQARLPHEWPEGGRLL